jgi:hypothetical protein
VTKGQDCFVSLRLAEEEIQRLAGWPAIEAA